MPDYSIEFDDKKDMVTFINRSKIEAPSDDEKENKAEWHYFVEYKIPYEYKETAKDRFGLEYNGNSKMWVYEGTDEPPQELEQYIVRKEMRKC